MRKLGSLLVGALFTAVLVVAAPQPASAGPFQRHYDAVTAPGVQVPVPPGAPINVTYASAIGFGEIALHSCGAAHPAIPPYVLPVSPGTIESNLVYTPLGNQCLTTSATTRVVLDEWPMPAGSFHPIAEHFHSTISVGQGATVQVDPFDGAIPPPNGNSGVALVIDATATVDTFLTVYNCATPRPIYASMTLWPQEVRSNVVYVPFGGSGGQVCVFNNGGTAEVDVSVIGWWDSAGGGQVPPMLQYEGSTARAPGFHPETPHRLFDTRSVGIVQPGQVVYRSFPAEQWAVSLNVTVTEPEAPGYLTAFPCDGPGGATDTPPLASNLNYATGQTVPNAVMVGTLAGLVESYVCFVSQSRTHLIVDQNGWFGAPGTGDGYQPLDPARLLDTRDGTGQAAGAAPIAPNSMIELQVTGRGGVPAAVTAVTLNMTATETATAGFLTVWPCGAARPVASSLNYSAPLAGVTTFSRANLVNVQVGTGGRVCIYSQGRAHVIADVAGWYGPTAPTGFVPFDVPERSFDTRNQNAAIGLTQVPARDFSRTGELLSGGVAGDGFSPQIDGLNVDAAVMNVTAVGSLGEGHVTAFPCGQGQPTASNLNLDPPRTVPNLAIVRAGLLSNSSLPGGPILSGVCYFVSRSTHLVGDMMGIFTRTPIETLAPVLTQPPI